MPIEVTCPGGHKLRLPDKLAGKTARCPKCNRTFEVPDLESIATEIDVIGAEDEESAKTNERREKRTTKSQPNRVLLGVAALSVLAVLVLAGVYFTGGFSSEAETDQTAKDDQDAKGDENTNDDRDAKDDENSQEVALKDDIEAAIKALQEKKYRKFIYDFLSRNQIARFESTRRSKGPESEFFSDRDATSLRDQLQACLSGDVSFNSDETIADVEYVLRPKEVIPAYSPKLPPGFGDAPPAPTSGLGGDLPKMLRAGIELLEAGQVEEFVRNVYPAAELARLSTADAMKRHLFRIESSPQMVEAMLRDLKEASAAEAVKSDGGNLATVTLPPLVPDDPDRVFKFEKVAGHWRFFDSDRPAGLHAEYVKLVKKPIDSMVIPGIRGVFSFEKSGQHWLIRKEPETYPLVD